jgi:hypothetical protein
LFDGLAGTLTLNDGRRFEGGFEDDFPRKGAYTDQAGARFSVEMQDKTQFSKVAEVGGAGP